MENVLLQGGMVWDGSGRPAFAADVLVQGSRITEVWQQTPRDFSRRVASTSPATPLSRVWSTVTRICRSCTRRISRTPETSRRRSTRCSTLRHARIVLEAGFTSCLSGGSAKPRLDVVIRDEINAGRIPGPRLLAASPELTNTGNLGDERRMHIHRESIAMVVDGADEMLRSLQHADARRCRHDQAQRLRQSNHPQLRARTSDRHARGRARKSPRIRRTRTASASLPTCARAASIKLALKHHIDILYHCEYADEECLDLLESARDRVFVAPAIGLLHNMHV